jgi:hypothetical protein
MKPVVAIIGAGPAGLTAALELVRDGRMTPIVFEASDQVGGISRTVEYKGNRMDIGGHRFFSKSDWVMNWWREILPIAADENSVEIAYHGQRREIATDDAPASEHGSVHARPPARCHASISCASISIIRSNSTARRWRTSARYDSSGSASVIHAATLFPRRNVRSLEDFLVNRFGTSCIARSSWTTPRRSGACRAARSAPNGAPSASRGYR